MGWSSGNISETTGLFGELTPEPQVKKSAHFKVSSCIRIWCSQKDMSTSWWQRAMVKDTLVLCYRGSMLPIKGEQFQIFPCSTELHKASFWESREILFLALFMYRWSVSLFFFLKAQNLKRISSKCTCASTQREVLWDHSSEWRPVPWAGQQIPSREPGTVQGEQKIEIWAKEGGREQKETEGETETEIIYLKALYLLLQQILKYLAQLFRAPGNTEINPHTRSTWE